jgi:hypothetical protein
VQPSYVIGRNGDQLKALSARKVGIFVPTSFPHFFNEIGATLSFSQWPLFPPETSGLTSANDPNGASLRIAADRIK